MNKLEQDTLEIIQEFLPRIAVALEEIAKAAKFEICYEYCAEIPKQEPKQEPKRVTNLQLTEWLAKGNGVWKRKNNDSTIYINSSFFEDLEEEEVGDFILIRPFGTKEWLEPTLENMGMEDK